MNVDKAEYDGVRVKRHKKGDVSIRMPGELAAALVSFLGPSTVWVTGKLNGEDWAYRLFYPLDDVVRKEGRLENIERHAEKVAEMTKASMKV